MTDRPNSSDFPGSLGLALPLFVAPMAGTSTPALAAAACNAGALGALGLGAMDVAAAGVAITETRARTHRPFQVNLFCHADAVRDPVVEAGWIARASPLFARFGMTPPTDLTEIYPSFRGNDAMLAMLLETRPPVISFHFGLPDADRIDALRGTGARLIATATSPDEARVIVDAGLDAIVAQGWQAGGHRGVFDPTAPDDRLTTEALTRQLARDQTLPVIAAGGLMNGADIAAALGWGASAAQMGSAFVTCPESNADAAWRDRMAAGGKTVMTRAISGRAARSLVNVFTRWAADTPDSAIPDYPVTYDLGKALIAAARAAGETGFGADWSGAQAPGRVRPLPAADLVALLQRELAEALAAA